MSNWFLYLAAFLVLAEVLLRLPVVQAALPEPEPTLWHSPLVDDKVDYFHAFAAANQVDVLFIGNSTAQAGIDPAIFDQFRTQLGAGGASFNGSIEGVPPTVLRHFLAVYLRSAQPHSVLLGLTPQDLNSNSPWAKDMEERAAASILLQAEAGESWMGNLLAFVLEHSQLFRYRYVLHQMLLRGGALPAHPTVYFDQRGFHGIERSLADFSPSERLQSQNRAGVLNYSPQGEQVAAVKEIVALVRSHGAQPVFVNMPLSDQYYANFDSPADYEKYQVALQQLADELAAPVWDMEALATEPPFGDSEFGDLNHLNRVGAERLSILLAQDYAAFAQTGDPQTAYPQTVNP